MSNYTPPLHPSTVDRKLHARLDELLDELVEVAQRVRRAGRKDAVRAANLVPALRLALFRRPDETLAKRCRMHGGLSTGAKTAEGRERLREAGRRGARERWRRAREDL